MDKSVQITSIIVLGILVLASIGFVMFQSIIPASKTINSNGESSVSTIPDLVTVYFNIKTDGKNLSSVQEENNKISDDLITNLVKQGFERKDIKTENFYIGPKYEWVNGEYKEDGYEATHSLKVEMSTDDSSKIGDSIDAGVDAGASVSYINFELSQEKQNQAKAEAIKLAAEDARIKAQALADGLGSELGDLVSVSNSYFGYSPWNVYSAREDSTTAEAKTAGANIQPGEQKISASVTAVFKIK